MRWCNEASHMPYDTIYWDVKVYAPYVSKAELSTGIRDHRC